MIRESMLRLKGLWKGNHVHALYLCYLWQDFSASEFCAKPYQENVSNRFARRRLLK